MTLENPTERELWLQSLKAGDRVFYKSGRFPSIPHIEPIERVTATQIIIGDRKWRRKDGNAVGDTYNTPSQIDCVTEEREALLADHTVNNAYRAFVQRTSMPLTEIPTDVKEQILSLVKPFHTAYEDRIERERKNRHESEQR